MAGISNNGMAIDRSQPNGTLDLRKPPAVKGIKPDAYADQFYGMMGPQMAQLEQDMTEQVKVIDDMNNKWKDEREAKQKAERQKHVPQPLKNSGQNFTQISKRIGGLFRYTNFPDRYVEKVEKAVDHAQIISQTMEELQESLKSFIPPGTPGVSGASEEPLAIEAKEEQEEEDDEFYDEGLIPSNLPELTELERALLLSHSMAAYATRLTVDHRERFYSRILNDTTQWITALFRVKDSTAMYHDEPSEGLINVTRLALAAKYPDYMEKGFDSLYSKPPVIYISEASQSGLAHILCRGLGLPESCICVVPCKQPEPGQIHKIDTEAFESLVNDHISSTREPVLLIAYASTPLLAAVDPLQKLKSICKAKNIWLHVEGLNLATLCLMSVPTNMVSVRNSDSCTLDMASWFGFPGSPSVTLYRKESENIAQLLNFTDESKTQRLKCLPLWIGLQAVGVDGMIERVKTAVQMTADVLQFLSKIPTVSIMLVFEMATPVVIFKYGKSRNTPIPEVAPYASQEQIEQKQGDDGRLNRYYECLNIWFVETIKRDCPHVFIEIVYIEDGGTAIKFSPLEHAYALGTTQDHIKEFLDVAKRQLSVMDATVSHRESFIEVVEAQDNLTYIEIPGYAGIGAVQYIPTDWLELLSDLPPKGKDEINKINMELVHQLKTSDSAFSLGHTSDNLACARFGLISQDTDMEELLGLVYTTGKDIEESSRFVEQMAELVKKGIEQANSDLEKENESRLMQEGVLRQIPMVSSLINWFSPPPKDISNLKGRAFNLSSGTVKSTEETYKHHMQILEEQPTTPKRQQPLKAILKPTPTAASNVPSSPSPSALSAVQEQSSVELSSLNHSTKDIDNSTAATIVTPSTSESDTSTVSSASATGSPSASTGMSSNSSPRESSVEQANNQVDLK